ncbi:MAG TPA: heme exporter protein CcmD [Stellaceae bacterium]|nr:heme exporter protein CcmD [Stellaceae bacterium]
MQGVDAFLAMGGYAAFVWPAYGLAVIVLGGFTLQSLTAYRRRQRELDLLQRERPDERRR